MNPPPTSFPITSLGHPHAPAASMLYPVSDIDWRFKNSSQHTNYEALVLSPEAHISPVTVTTLMKSEKTWFCNFISVLITLYSTASE